jgi:hypothetical protein
LIDINPEEQLNKSSKESPTAMTKELSVITGDKDAKDGMSTPVQTVTTSDVEYPSGLRLALIITSAFVSMFLVSLVFIPVL